MDKALQSFLVDLATDTRKLNEYARDRVAYLEKTDLSPEAKQAVLAGDQTKITELAGSSTGGHTKRSKMKQYKKKAAKKKAAKKKAAKKKAKKK